MSDEAVAVTLLRRIDTLDEFDHLRHGGILPSMLRRMARAA